MGGYLHVGPAIKDILGHFNWSIAAFLYHNHDQKTNKGFSSCSYAMASVFRAINNNESVHLEFDENSVYKEKLMNVLQIAKRSARSKYFVFFFP